MVDLRNTRCGEKHHFNNYKWSECPFCEAEENNVYALICKDCANAYYNRDRLENCPECGSRFTAQIAP